MWIFRQQILVRLNIRQQKSHAKFSILIIKRLDKTLSSCSCYTSCYLNFLELKGNVKWKKEKIFAFKKFLCSYPEVQFENDTEKWPMYNFVLIVKLVATWIWRNSKERLQGKRNFVFFFHFGVVFNKFCEKNDTEKIEFCTFMLLKPVVTQRKSLATKRKQSIACTSFFCKLWQVRCGNDTEM